MRVNSQFYADMFTFTKKILNGKVHFCALICPSKQTENYYEEENNLFFKNCVASLFTIFEKVLEICKYFYRLVFRCKVYRPFAFYLFEVQSTVFVSSEAAIQRCSKEKVF